MSFNFPRSFENQGDCVSNVNTGKEPAILFSHTDVPVMRSLDLYREEAHPAGRQ